MEIIPVIDIMGGKLVQARGGDRAHYPLLNSVLSKSHHPQQVISDLLHYYPFKTIYIADLDAIEMDADNHAMYRALMAAFPKVDFWIDAGIKTKQCWHKLTNYLTVTPVIGSESLVDSEWLLSENIKSHSILSLDFKKGMFLGQAALVKQAELWTERVIVMNLDHVGERSGPNLEQLKALKQRSQHSQLIAAGGIRDQQDLIRLAEQGIEQVLVASALHAGTLTAAEL